MIVKNEQENLSRCLESVKEIVDEMIIVDTGSTDDTVRIAESFGAKVYSYQWKDDFSDARNQSLKHASCDWILLMDGDDELDKSSQREVLELVEKNEAEAYFFKTVSYIGDKPGLDVLNNLNLRLMKNGKGYFFSNPIHEQIYSNIMRITPNAKIVNLDIKVYHYGYLNKNIKGQDKRKRNIRILEKELEHSPGYGFSLFNLGNEYYASGSYLKALECYEQSYAKFDAAQGFSSKLIIKMVNCLINCRKYERALELVTRGLAYYPEFTELEYFRSTVYLNQMKYTMALRHLEKCIEMGEPPLHLSMVEGVGSYRAYYIMGEIYYKLEDFEEAAECFSKSVSLCIGFDPAITKLYLAKCKLKPGTAELEKYIEKLHKGLSINADNRLLDILIQEKYYELALKYVSRLERKNGKSDCLTYYRCVCKLMLKKYKETLTAAGSIRKESEYGTRAACLMMLIRVLEGNLQQAEKILESCGQDTGDRLVNVYRVFISCLNGKGCEVLSEDEIESGNYSVIIFDLLRILLAMHELVLFEKALSLLNTIEDKTVLLKLAKVYYNEQCYESAYQEFIRSIKLFEAMDPDGAESLCRLKSRGF